MSFTILGQQHIEYTGGACGSCTYCCWMHSIQVPGFDGSIYEKPAHENCLWQQPASSDSEFLQEVFDTPHPATGALLSGGCRLYGDPRRPENCRLYVCPYVLSLDASTRRFVVVNRQRIPYPVEVHRPDAFLDVVRELAPKGAYVMPFVPALIPLDQAHDLIRQTKTIPDAKPDRSDGSVPGQPQHGFLAGICSLSLLATAEDVQFALAAWNALVARYCYPQAQENSS